MEIEKKRYAATLGIMATIGATFLWMFRKKINWWVWFRGMIIGGILGLSWQAYTTWCGGSHPGWWYEPGRVLGYIKGISYEDIIFYFVCGNIIFIMWQLIPNYKHRMDVVFNLIFTAILTVLSIVSFFVYKEGGISITFVFAIPAIGMCFYNANRTCFKKFIIVLIAFTALGETWDILEHLTKAPAWLYISNAGHSSLWIKNEWSWIMGKIPSEITWFMFSGTACVYQIFDTLDEYRTQKLFYAAMVDADKTDRKMTR